MDNYVVFKCSSGRGIYFYYKNDKLHREAGPAIVYRSHRRKFTNLIDEGLYKEEIIDDVVPFDFVATEVVENSVGLCQEITAALYYLDGQAYTKKDFEQLKVILDLKKDLGNELKTNQSKIKRVKL